MSTKSVLTTLWPILKLLQILGSCPIKKHGQSPTIRSHHDIEMQTLRNNGFKQCEFKPFSSATYFVILVFVYIGVYSASGIIMSYLFYVQGLDWNMYSKILFDSQGSKMNNLSFFALSGSMLTVSLTMCGGNFRLKDRFIELLQLFWSLNLQENTSRRKYFLTSVITSWYFLVIFSAIALYFHEFNLGIELNSVSLLLIGFILFITQTLQMSPIVGFLVFYTEACHQLNTWIERLNQQFKSKQDYHLGAVSECSLLLNDGLKKTSSAFSNLLFWISSLYLTAMIFCTYLFLAFSSKLLNGGLSESDLSYIIPLSVGSNAIIQTLVYINILSQDVTTNLHDLKDCISDIGTRTKRMMFY